jgi:tetratricopeptide (TPR) repeat protein
MTAQVQGDSTMNKPGRNDPCPCGSGKKYKQCHLGRPDDVWPHEDSVALADSFPEHYSLADELDGDAWDDELDDLPPVEYTPLDEAWDVVEEAWDEPNPKQRVKLAKEALHLSPDCAGAYFILAMQEQSPSARMPFFDQTVAAAERTLAPRTLDDLAPFEWVEYEVEYALYAMQHRALAHLEQEQPDEAIAIYRRLLELDPTDRLNVRLLLMLQLMVNEELDAAAEVERESTFDSSEDPTWAFARALIKFQREGDSVFARRALAEAIMLYPQHTDILRDALAAAAENKTLLEDVPDLDEALDNDEELISELVQIAGDEGAMDALTAVPTIYAIGMHSLLWQMTDGAGQWFQQVIGDGPATRYDNHMLGDGPLLRMTPSKQEGYRHCPNCHKPTNHRPIDLVVQLEDDPIVAFEVNARVCPVCDIVLVAMEDLARRLPQEYPQSSGRDFMPLGIIAESERRAGADAEWLVRHLRPFRKVEDLDADRLDWPTLESQRQEIEDLLNKTGLTGLLGPLIHP